MPRKRTRAGRKSLRPARAVIKKMHFGEPCRELSHTDAIAGSGRNGTPRKHRHGTDEPPSKTATAPKEAAGPYTPRIESRRANRRTSEKGTKNAGRQKRMPALFAYGQRAPLFAAGSARSGRTAYNDLAARTSSSPLRSRPGQESHTYSQAATEAPHSGARTGIHA